MDEPLPLMPLGSPQHVEQVVSLALQIAHGLAHIHAKGIIHADLNPNNGELSNSIGVSVCVCVIFYC